jgi:hypothetical protein
LVRTNQPVREAHDGGGNRPFGLAVAYVFRPTEQKLVLMRPVSLAAIFATVSGLLGGWIAVLARIPATPDGHLPVASLYRGIAESLTVGFVSSACSPPPGCLWLSAGYDVTLLLHLQLPLRELDESIDTWPRVGAARRQRASSHVRIDESVRHDASPDVASSTGPARSMAFRFISRSTVAYRFVVVTLA